MPLSTPIALAPPTALALRCDADTADWDRTPAEEADSVLLSLRAWARRPGTSR